MFYRTTLTLIKGNRNIYSKAVDGENVINIHTQNNVNNLGSKEE